MGKIITATVYVLMLFAAVPAQEKIKTLEDLGWLSGCWEANDKAKHMFSSEQWMKPAGGMMLGIGRTVKNGKAVDFEFMRIEQRGSDIFFISKPKANKEETPFKLIGSRAFEAVFENLDHDFPQRVIYRRHGAKLAARIEGNFHNETRRFLQDGLA